MRNPEITVEATIKHCCKILAERLDRPEERAGLLVGCGQGNEVVYLRRTLGSRCVVGLDVNASFSFLARQEIPLVVSDAKRMPFADGSYDFAVAIHSLEHVGDPYQALAEVRRVLRPGAWFYVGVPNRTRLLGYLGSMDVTPWQKFAWNLVDYRERLLGRFKNELGAHAGFDAKELESLLRAYFIQVEMLTEAYQRFKYGNRLPKRALDLLLSPRLINYSAPSHYAVCQTP